MRKRQAKKRPLLPDPKFNDQLVTRFVNMIMWDGKKSVAFKIFYDAIAIVEERSQDEEKTALEVWKEALSNVMPHVEVRSRRCWRCYFSNSYADSTRSKSISRHEMDD